MQVVRFSLLFMAPFLLLYACQSTENTASTDKFTLIGISSDSLDTLASLNLKDTTLKSKIINDTFRFELSINDKQTGSLNLDKSYEKIFAQPGHDIQIVLSKDTTIYSGSLAPIYQEYEELVDRHLEGVFPKEWREMYALQQDTFQELIYTGINNIEEDIDTSLDNSLEDWGYLLWAEATHNWAYYTFLYPRIHPRVSEDTSYTVPFEYYEEAIEKFNIEDATLLRSASREELIKSAVENWARIDTPYIESDSGRILFMFDIAEKMYEQDTISQIAKFHVVLDQLKYQGFGDAKPLVTDFLHSLNDPDKKNELNELISDWEKIEKGNPAPDFTAQTPDTTQYSLNDFKGKMVYLDVWATWCGPCLREVPFLEEMHERYSDEENLEIISVSIDADYQKWHDMVTEKQMEGLQLWTENAWDSKLNEKYMIRSIPRFILIDQKGNIIDADAPRPSSKEELYALIDQQLQAD